MLEQIKCVWVCFHPIPSFPSLLFLLLTIATFYPILCFYSIYSFILSFNFIFYIRSYSIILLCSLRKACEYLEQRYKRWSKVNHVYRCVFLPSHACDRGPPCRSTQTRATSCTARAPAGTWARRSSTSTRNVSECRTYRLKTTKTRTKTRTKPRPPNNPVSARRSPTIAQYATDLLFLPF